MNAIRQSRIIGGGRSEKHLLAVSSDCGAMVTVNPWIIRSASSRLDVCITIFCSCACHDKGGITPNDLGGRMNLRSVGDEARGIPGETEGSNVGASKGGFKDNADGSGPRGGEKGVDVVDSEGRLGDASEEATLQA